MEHRHAFTGLCVPGTGSGYRVGAERRRAECFVTNAERCAKPSATVAFDRTKILGTAGADRTSTADAKRSASTSGAIQRAIIPNDLCTAKHLSRLRRRSRLREGVALTGLRSPLSLPKGKHNILKHLHDLAIQPVRGLVDSARPRSAASYRRLSGLSQAICAGVYCELTP
jgi:hypothetical protein